MKEKQCSSVKFLTAGETYCGIATLALLGRLPSKYSKGGSTKNGETAISEDFIESTIRWLVYRQTSMFQEEAEDEYTIHDNEMSHHQPTASHLPQVSDIQAALPTLPEASHTNSSTSQAVLPPTHTSLPPLAPSHTAPQLSHNAPSPSHTAPEFSYAASDPSHASPSQPQPTPAPLTILPSSLLWAGFNGRCNKVADTCYSFWVGGTLSVTSLPLPLSPSYPPPPFLLQSHLPTSLLSPPLASLIPQTRSSTKPTSPPSTPTGATCSSAPSTPLAALARTPGICLVCFPHPPPFFFLPLPAPFSFPFPPPLSSCLPASPRPTKLTAFPLSDILHSYLGLAALATMREPELKRLDAALCVSVGAREGLEGVR